jgi:hypothetical protein
MRVIYRDSSKRKIVAISPMMERASAMLLKMSRKGGSGGSPGSARKSTRMAKLVRWLHLHKAWLFVEKAI